MQHELLRLVDARMGHFRYESGHHGDLWLDLDRLLEKPKFLRPFVFDLTCRLAVHNPQLICGPLTGGAVLAQMLATGLGLDACYAERVDSEGIVTYSLASTARDSLRGRRVALVDDAINAGSAVFATLDELQSCGANVVAIGALLTLGSRAATACGKLKMPLESVANLSSHLWLPAECPLCAAGTAIEQPDT